jgi:hypothetical protein
VKLSLLAEQDMADMKTTEMNSTQSNVLDGDIVEHSKGIVEKLQSFCRDKSMCDVTLTAGDYSIQAHKVVLAANSDYFCAMFSGNWTEKQKDNVTLHELTPLGLKAIIEFSYHGTLTVDIENIGEIVSAIHHCQLVKACKPCEDYLINKINKSNFATFLDISNTFQLHRLQKELLGLFAQELAPSYLNDKDSFLDGLKTSLLKPTLQEWNFTHYGLGQMAAFDFVLKWTKKNERADDLQDLLSAVNRNSCDVAKAVRYCQLTPRERALEAKSEGTNLISVSGNKHNEYFDAIVYNIDSRTWRKLPQCPSPITQPLAAGVAVLDGVLYVCGGDHSSSERYQSVVLRMGVPSAVCHKFDPCLDRWIPVQSMQRTRTSFPLLPFEGKLYALGGLVKSAPTLTVEVYDPETDKWTNSLPLPKAMHDHAAVVHDGKIYISGGHVYENTLEMGHLYCYNPQTRSWSEKEPMHCPRIQHILMSHGDFLYQFGGRVHYTLIQTDGTEEAYWNLVDDHQVECYDVTADMWNKVPAFDDVGDEDLSHYLDFGSCAVNNCLYVLRQEIRYEKPEALLIFKFDPETEEVTECFSGKEMIVSHARTLLPFDLPSIVYDCIPAKDEEEGDED